MVQFQYHLACWCVCLSYWCILYASMSYWCIQSKLAGVWCCWCRSFAHVDLYTVKRLESGGFEVEFPCADYLPKIRDQLDKRYPTLKWHDSACKQEATLKVARPGLTLSTGRYRVRVPSCQLIVQLGSAVVGERRLWVSDAKASSSCQQYAGAWIDSELCHIYRSAHQSLQQQQQQIASSPTTSDIWWRHWLRHCRRQHRLIRVRFRVTTTDFYGRGFNPWFHM